MKQADKDWIKKADEANMFFQIQAVGGKLFRMSTHKAIAKATNDTGFLQDFKDNEEIMARLRMELHNRFGIGFSDFDIWVKFWQEYTQNMAHDKLTVLITRILGSEPVPELLPKQTYQEWFNETLKHPGALPR